MITESLSIGDGVRSEYSSVRENYAMNRFPFMINPTAPQL